MIIQKLRNIKLNETQESYLHYIALYPHSSAYDIANPRQKDDHGEENLKINDNRYRQAKNIVNKLHNLHLIDKEKVNSHNKHPCSLTDVGLFYLIRSPFFLRINLQTLIKNHGHSKIFNELVFPFIKSETLIAVDMPIDILNQISLYIQQHYSMIENFIFKTENKKDWIVSSWNIEKLRRYLINKYKYKWLEDAETKENYEQTILKFFNENKPNEYINIRIQEKYTWGILIIVSKKKKQAIIPNIKSFRLHLSKEEKIGRLFSTLYTMTHSKFIFSLLTAWHGINLDALLLFSRDEKFIQSLKIAKEDFNKIYLSIKNPHEYSIESRLVKIFLEDSFTQEIKRINNKLSR